MQLLSQHCPLAISTSSNCEAGKKFIDWNINIDVLNYEGYSHTVKYMNECSPAMELEKLFQISTNNNINAVI